MVRLLLLDSGAFTVWSQGASIDLGAYLEFCHQYPGCSYYVNLDVIPGLANQKRTITAAGVEESCKAGWANWKRMIRELPPHKVIPVYHQNDDVKWLVRYIEAGAPYVGISPANDMTTRAKMLWMGGLRKYLFDGAGRPTVKTHGFAVTSYDLMKFWDWHSVDSASWKLSAAWGGLYLPRRRGGDWCFSEAPLLAAVSPMSPSKDKRQHHVSTMSPGVRAQLMAWLDHCGVELGTFDTYQAQSAEYKLDREAGEVWFDKDRRVVLRPTEKGVTTSFEVRARVNARFMKQANEVLPVEHLYFAGAPMPYKLEWTLGRRLLSYHELSKGKSRKYITGHIQRMEGSNAGQ